MQARSSYLRDLRGFPQSGRSYESPPHTPLITTTAVNNSLDKNKPDAEDAERK
jgi:hypothetical protein